MNYILKHCKMGTSLAAAKIQIECIGSIEKGLMYGSIHYVHVQYHSHTHSNNNRDGLWCASVGGRNFNSNALTIKFMQQMQNFVYR
jgi:hypothetical protein